MTKYICTSCETTFEHDSGKLRCPRCLRQHGLVEEGSQAPPKKKPVPKRRLLILGLLVLSVIGLAAGSALLYHRSRTDVPGPGQLALLDDDLLTRTLVKRGVPAHKVVNPLVGGAAVKALAGSVQEADPKKRARALARKVAAIIKGLKPDLRGEGQDSVLVPEELLAAIKAGKKPRVFSFELAALMVSVLRAADLEAVLAQVHRVEAPMPTADPGGAAGRYLAVVYRGEELGRQALLTLDPVRALELPSWAGKDRDPEMSAGASGAMEPLDDASAAGHLLSLRALRSPREASREAYLLSELAIKASAPSATLHVARAMVLAAAGGKADALAAAHKALSLRRDPPRYTAVAMLSLARHKPEGALHNLQQAIKLDPNFWPAHQILAMVMDKPEESDRHMKAALAVAPEEPSVMMAQAARLLAGRKLEPAIKLLRKVIASHPGREARLMLYQALMVTGQKEEAARVKANLLATARGPERAALQKLFGAMTSPSAAAPPTRDPAASPPRAPRIRSLKLPDVTLGK